MGDAMKRITLASSVLVLVASLVALPFHSAPACRALRAEMNDRTQKIRKIKHSTDIVI